MIYEKAELLCESLEKQLDQNGIAEMRTNFMAWTTDVIGSYALSRPLRFLEDQQAAADWQMTTKAVLSLTPLQKQFPWLVETALRLPLAPLQIMFPDLARSVGLYWVRSKAFVFTLKFNMSMQLC